MRVVFDSQIFSAQTFGGISRYFASLAKALNHLPDLQAQIAAPFHSNGYLQALPKDIVRGPSAFGSHKPKALLRVASLATGGLLQLGLRPDILHKTYYYPIPALPSKARTVLTVYDMIHEKFPHYFAPRDPIARWKRRAVQRADQIICISEHTRRDLLSAYPDIKPSKVAVTLLGFDTMEEPLNELSGGSCRPGVLADDYPYILFVGHRAGYKNFSGLLAAYQASPWLQQHFRLLCFGGGPFTAEENALISKGCSSERVLQLGGSDTVLASCYRHAALFVYPSLYEGFGIPPLEAMSVGCPVACGNTSSIPEVVGDAAAFFDPGDIDNMRTALENTLNSPAAAAALVARGWVRSARFSWQKCAAETAQIYRETLTR